MYRRGASRTELTASSPTPETYLFSLLLLGYLSHKESGNLIVTPLLYCEGILT